MVLEQQVKWVLNFEQSRESVRPMSNWTANDSLFGPFILSRLERTSDHHTLMATRVPDCHNISRIMVCWCGVSWFLPTRPNRSSIVLCYPSSSAQIFSRVRRSRSFIRDRSRRIWEPLNSLLCGSKIRRLRTQSLNGLWHRRYGIRGTPWAWAYEDADK